MGKRTLTVERVAPDEKHQRFGESILKLLYANDRQGEHASSWYAATTQAPALPSLESHLHTDVCIVGAGFTGLAAALELSAQGIACVVLEAHRVGWGASGRNGGQLGTGFNMDQQELESLMGSSMAHKLWDISEQAKRWIFSQAKQHSFDIEYRPGIVYAQHRQRFVKPLHDYCEFLKSQYQYDAMSPLGAEDIRAHVNSDDYYGGSVDTGAGHIHPLKLTHGLAAAAMKNGATILERSEVAQIQKRPGKYTQRVVTATGSVSCERVIMATNGYVDALDHSIHKRLMPINNFIAVTEPLGDLAAQLLPKNEAVADSRFVVNYYRRVDDDRILFGGGENYSYQFPQHIAPLVRKAMLGVFPSLNNASIDYAWGGTLAITRNRLPFIGEISPQRFAAGGYSGHGVSLACIYGCALANYMTGDSEVFDVLSQIPNTAFPGGVRSRPALLAMAMTGYSWLDKW